MKKINDNKLHIILIIIVVLTSIINISMHVGSKSKQEENIFTNLPADSVSFGLIDSNNKVINQGELLSDFIVNNELDVVFEFSQNFIDSRNYSIIMLNDFEQIDFAVEGEKCNNYNFTLNKKDEISIQLNIIPNPNSNELSIIIIKEPNQYIEAEDFMKAIMLQNLYSLRYNIDSERNRNLFSNDISVEDIQLENLYIYAQDYVNITNKLDEFKISTYVNKEEDNFVDIGNLGNETSEFCIVALCDWKQVNILENCNKIIVELNPNEVKYFQMYLDNININSNYQILVFNSPNNLSNSDRLTQEVFYSNRVIVK